MILTPLIEEQHERVNLLRKAAIDEAQVFLREHPETPQRLIALFNVLRAEEEQFHELLVNAQED